MEYRLRDQGKDYGSCSIEQIESMLDDHRIGLMAEVYDGGQWITVDELLDRIEHHKLAESEEAERQRVEHLRREEQEQRKLEIELELERERTRQMEMIPDSPSSPTVASPPVVNPSAHQTTEDNLNKGTVISGYICMGMSLLCCPILFGLAGVILGIVNCCLGGKNVMHGAIQIGGTIICSILGTFLGLVIQGMFAGGF